MSDPTLRAFGFRATHPDYRDLHHTVAMSRQYPMRFNTTTVGAVYICEDPQTAVEELRRRAKLARRRLASFTPRSMFVLEVVLHRILDLVEPDIRGDWGLSEEDLEGAVALLKAHPQIAGVVFDLAPAIVPTDSPLSLIQGVPVGDSVGAELSPR